MKEKKTHILQVGDLVFSEKPFQHTYYYHNGFTWGIVTGIEDRFISIYTNQYKECVYWAKSWKPLTSNAQIFISSKKNKLTTKQATKKARKDDRRKYKNPND